MGLPGGSDSKESACNAGALGLIPGSGTSPREGNGYPLPVFLPGEFHGQKSLAGCSLWGGKELDMTEQPTYTHITPKQQICTNILTHIFIHFYNTHLFIE